MEEVKIVRAKRLVLPDSVIQDGAVVVHGEKIAAVGGGSQVELPDAGQVFDMGNRILAPGLIDQMVHGSHGYKAGVTLEETLQFGKVMLNHGVTSFLPTVAFSPTVEEMRQALSVTSQAVETDSDGSQMLGINFEAPFFTREGKSQWDRYPPAGYYAGKMARDPSVDELRSYQEAAGGHIKLMTIAPELDGALDVIREMLKQTDCHHHIEHTVTEWQPVCIT